MSAQLDNLSDLRPMRAADLDRVMEVEPTLYAHPWTRGNFDDSIKSGYSCRVLECGGVLAGYGVLMIGVREAHLLNLSVAARWQRRGIGREALGFVLKLARDCGAEKILLEVRPSNNAAIALYGSAGFAEIARRRGYYPAGDAREDAIVLQLGLR